MSKKSFILTALVINLTICLTLCVVLFTGKNKSNDGMNKIEVEKTSNDIGLNEEQKEDEESTTDLVISNTTTAPTTATTLNETTTKIVESQVSSETLPSTYNNKETTEMTTTPQETTTTEPVPQVNGSTAIINSSCNIRSSADVGGNVVGTAKTGASYKIDPTKCSTNWIAIYIDENTLGYISTTFCTIQ